MGVITGSASAAGVPSGGPPAAAAAGRAGGPAEPESGRRDPVTCDLVIRDLVTRDPVTRDLVTAAPRPRPEGAPS